ncbi:MAG: hypothetical protein Q4G40_09930 [Brachybacterium sp.]|nr:hypothetical protein [Brachybacterium sp.]
MVKRTILNPDPRAALADLRKRVAAQGHVHATRPAGVSDLGEHGDVIWRGPGRDGVVHRSVRRFAVELDDTTERAAALEQRLADATAELEAARDRIAQARRELEALDTRVVESSRQVSRGPLPPRGAPMGAQWVTPTGHLYVRVPCEEEVA